MKRNILTILFLILGITLASAQKVVTRSGEYTYVASQDESLAKAMDKAVQRAKLKILEDEFGTVVGVSNLSRTANVNGSSSSDFMSISETEVEGEWLETVGSPTFERFFENDMLVIKVKITGKIRQRVHSAVELDVRILKNGAELKYVSDVFRNNDDIFIYFKSPQKGYLAVYQFDSDGVFRLLPYLGADNSTIPVKGGKEYILFDRKSRDGLSLLQDLPSDVKSNYHIVCTVPEDLCKYYIVFSPNIFYIANDKASAENVPASLEIETFRKWLGHARNQDKDMVVVEKNIILKNK